jgi:rhodanese-related sulfurtransferase
MVSIITCEQLKKEAAGDSLDIVDVRTPMEFAELHAVGARNMPLDQLDPQAVMQGRNGNGDAPLYIICRSGSRAARACEAFESAGFSNVVNIDGGTMAWEQAGLPVVRSARKVISLERQVRIAAGALALLGAVLALTVHPWFAGLSGFIGAGLMFAGITDTCGMGLMLAKMPWNRVPAESESGQSTCKA